MQNWHSNDGSVFATALSGRAVGRHPMNVCKWPNRANAIRSSSVARRIGVIAAGGAIVGIGAGRRRTQRSPTHCGGTDRCSTVAPAVPGTASDVGTMPDAGCADAAYAHSARADESAASVEATEAAGVETTSMEASEPEAVDEERCRPVATGQLAFEHIHIEGDPITLQLCCLQHHNGIADIRPILAEHRDSGVRRILGKAP